jgi:hypothetical protein
VSPQEYRNSDKSADLSLPVPHCPSLSVKENDYEQRRSQIRVLPSALLKVLQKRDFLVCLRLAYHHAGEDDEGQFEQEVAEATDNAASDSSDSPDSASSDRKRLDWEPGYVQYTFPTKR